MMDETPTRTPPEFLFYERVNLGPKNFQDQGLELSYRAQSVKSLVQLTKLPARTERREAVWPTPQWAAVMTVFAFRRDPPQK